jgi:hypothetical protein
MLNTQPPPPLTRIVAGLTGLAMICLALAPLLRRGDLFYANWFGGIVFAPFAILPGVFSIRPFPS